MHPALFIYQRKEFLSSPAAGGAPTPNEATSEVGSRKKPLGILAAKRRYPNWITKRWKEKKKLLDTTCMPASIQL